MTTNDSTPLQTVSPHQTWSALECEERFKYLLGRIETLEAKVEELRSKMTTSTPQNQ